MLLADLGAEVIKVESPAGDDTRHWVPPTRGDTGTYYLAINRNKRSIVLDLRDADDLEVAHRLTQRADVMIQNFKPGGLAKFGLDYESVRGRRPDVIYCSISGFGAGKGASLPGYDLLAQAVSGLMSLTGSPDGPPYRAGISVFDVLMGLQSAVGILSALHHRDHTGQGQHVELNLLSTALSSLVNQSSAYVAGGVVPNRMGNAHLSLFPYEPLPTGDGELIVIAGNDAQFRNLAVALGIPEVADDERFATVGMRNVNREQLRPILLDRLATRTAQEWFETLTAAGIACGPINDVRGGVELATELGLEPVVAVGGVPTVRNAIRMSETPPRYDLAPPKLDEHGAEIRQWLGAREAHPHARSAETDPPVPSA
jgi:crotonobetainyl-CoA:carnitine CoA-transferase CaiB-like acyl-CoA transferase